MAIECLRIHRTPLNDSYREVKGLKLFSTPGVESMDEGVLKRILDGGENDWNISCDNFGDSNI